MSVQTAHYPEHSLLTAKEASRFVNYTSDYITRLAREGKVAALQQNRQWLVDMESLKLFELQTKKEKALRQEQLREARKQEIAAARLSASTTQSLEQFEKDAPKTIVATTLVMATAFVIAFVSSTMVLPWMTNPAPERGAGAGLTLFENEEDKKEEIQENAIDEREYGQASLAPSPAPAAPRMDKRGLVLLSSSTPDAAVEEVRSYFSDEVAVSFDDDDTGIITPVFTEKSSSSYRFLLVPVAAASPDTR